MWQTLAPSWLLCPPVCHAEGVKTPPSSQVRQWEEGCERSACFLLEDRGRNELVQASHSETGTKNENEVEFSKECDASS